MPQAAVAMRVKAVLDVSLYNNRFFGDKIPTQLLGSVQGSWTMILRLAI